MILTTDNEASIRSLARCIKGKVAINVILRTRVKGNSASLASGETAVQLVKKRVKTICSEFQSQSAGKVLPCCSDLMPWIVMYATFSKSRFQVGHDGTTPYSRLDGSAYNGAVQILERL